LLIIWISAVIVSLIAGVTDFRDRRIPNWLTVSSLFLGIALNTILGHWRGLKLSLIGAGLSLGILLPFVLLRGLGAGDWKLMGALGAILGPAAWVVLLGTTLIAGVMAVIQVLTKRRVRQTLSNVWLLIKVAMFFGLRGRPAITLDSPGATGLPFGIAAAFATTACFLTVVIRFHARF
jgi:prepilin peptidase CpaA